MTISRGLGRTCAASAAAFCLLTFVPAGSATAAGTTPTVPSAPVVAVDNGAANQSDPRVAGNLVAYVDDASGVFRIHYRDLVTGVDALVPMGDDGQDALPDVAGTVISYVHFGSVRTSAWTFDTATGAAPVELDPMSTGRQFQAAIGGTTVAVQDFGLHGSDETMPGIVAYNRVSGARTLLTPADATGYSSEPAVSPAGDVVSWTTCPQTQTDCHVFVASRAGGVWSTPRELAPISGRPMTQPSTDEQSDTDGSLVTYADTRNGERDIYWVSTNGGAESHLALPGSDNDPSLSGGVISFSHTEPSGLVVDVYAYNIATGTLYRVTDSAGAVELSDASVDGARARIVWGVLDGGGLDVYSRTFDLPSADVVAPVITLTRPTDATAYVVHQQVTAAYICDDGAGSGVATCAGTSPNGAALDTAATGARSFTVTAADVAGNTATKTVSYAVGYNLCLLYDASASHRAGSTIPLKLQVCDATGNNASAATVSVTAGRVTKRDSTASPVFASDSGNANPDGGFRYDASQNSYIYNLSTKGLTTGTWSLDVVVGSDPTAHSIQFDVR